MHRKLVTASLVAALLAGTGTASAQDFVFSWNPRTGDVWVDQRLGDINDAFRGLTYETVGPRGALLNEPVRLTGAAAGSAAGAD